METFSMNVIAQSLTPHIETIAPGVMGINFMKPEKPINTMSEVYKLVQEEEQNKGKSPTPPPGCMSPVFRPSKVPPAVAPKPKATPTVNASVPFSTPQAPKPQSQAASVPDGPQHGPCSDCGRIIIGPYVGLSDRSLHEECFKCSTCGSSLKNIGYHNINNKLYCEMHAKLAAKVIATSSGAAPAFAPAAAPAAPKPVQAPVPKPVQPPTPKPSQTPVTPMMPIQPPTLPTLPLSSIPPSIPTPYGQNLANLPQTPSSSGGLAFRSISPQPFKRISGDYHKVTAPTSPTPGSHPSAPLSFSSGPLPFEMKPYMPPDQSLSSMFSSATESSQITESSKSTHTQIVQRTTQVSQQITQQSSQSQFAVDYKALTGQQKTKFVWPPPKSPFEIESSSTVSSSTSTTAQTYSPLATQSTPANVSLPQKSEAPPTFRSVQPPVAPQSQAVEAPVIPTPPSTFSVPPLPTTFSAEPANVEETKVPEPIVPAPEPKKEEYTAPAPPPLSGAQPQNFAPVLPPIVELKTQPTPAAQPGIPTGAGSKPAPKKGKGQLKEQAPGCRIPICADCGDPIRGPFIIALSRTWCPNHFHCNNLHCKTPLIDIGFVEEQGQLYCEHCYEAFLAPICNKCNVRIKGDCLNALDKQWHPECFLCAYCHKPFGNNSFYLEDGLPYCEKDWNELFTTKCVGCGFPIEAGDRWVEALNNNYHSQCFKCSICNKNLEGQSFYAKGGRPFCKAHAR